MLKWFSLILLLTVPAIAGAQAADYSQMNMPVEIRAVWIDAGAIPKTEAGVRQLVRSYAKANINLLFPETIMRGYAMYPSKLLARDPRFAGAPDVLAIMIDEAHRHRMEVHPWVWAFRAGYSKDKGAILSAHPDWAERGINGEELSPNGGYWISPTVLAARDFLANLYAELVSCYNLDGIHLDYIRYEVDNKVPYGYSSNSKALFERQYGVNPEKIERFSIHKYEWNKFRERQVNTFVQRIALQTRCIKPNAMVSAAVGPEPDGARLELMQNWANWVANGWVDFLTPMAYSTDDPYFTKIVSEQERAVHGKGLIAPGIGTFAQKTFEQSIRQIGMARKLGVSGQAFFAASYLHEPQLAALLKESYSKPAVLPFRNPAAACESLTKCVVSAKTGDRSELANIYSTHMSATLVFACQFPFHAGFEDLSSNCVPRVFTAR